MKKAKGITVMVNERRVMRIKPGITLEQLKAKYPEKSIEQVCCVPSMATMERWVENGSCKAVDGCGGIEPDGHCSHGKPSWLLVMGLI